MGSKNLLENKVKYRASHKRKVQGNIQKSQEHRIKHDKYIIVLRI